MYFEDLQALQVQIHHLITGISTADNFQFEIQPIEVKKVQIPAAIATQTTCPDMSYTQLERYFTDQHLKADSHHNKQRTHQDTIFREIEKLRDRRRKMKCRQDDVYKQNEKHRNSLAQKNRRQDDEYKQNEKHRNKVANQKRRQDAVYKQNEKHRNKVANQKRRQDAVYKQNEKHRNKVANQKCRQDAVYKQNEKHRNKVANQKRRQDAVYKQNEKHRNKVANQKCRQDAVYKQNEKHRNKVANQKRRQDAVYKQNEKHRNKVANQKCRQDAVYKQNEKHRNKVAKQKRRQDAVYKQNEKHRNTLSELKRRQDDVYKENVKRRRSLAKLKSRWDKLVTEIERQRNQQQKRITRQDQLVQERERWGKRQCKQNASHVISNHANNRSQNKNSVTSFIQEQPLQEDFGCRSDQTMWQTEHDQEHATVPVTCAIESSVQIFKSAISQGPTYVCSSCHQVWFKGSVQKASSLPTNVLQNPVVQQCLTGYKSVDNDEWLCITCTASLKCGKIPKLSKQNKMAFPDKPSVLNLHPLEERLISLRIPFMQIRQLPRGGQLSIKGNVVNVPVDVSPTVNALPRTLDDSATVSVKLKKKRAYKSSDFVENVRPSAVLSALHWLMSNSEMYQSAEIHIDNQCMQQILERELTACENDDEDQQNEDTRDIDNDGFNEIDDMQQPGRLDTLLDDPEINATNKLVFAPGEGQRPLGIFQDPDAEYLSFPTIYCRI